MADPNYPDDVRYHPEHDWARIDPAHPGEGDIRDHLVRAGILG